MARGKNPVEALPRFEGRDVIGATIAIRKAGDGLSAALGVDPAAYHHGDKVYCVLECDVSDVQHPPAIAGNLDGPLMRKHIFTTVGATMIDEDAVREALDATAVKLEEKSGVQRINFGDGDGEVYDD